MFPDEPTSNRAVLIKTALDQLVWGPVMLVVFVGESLGLLRCLGAQLPGVHCLPAGQSSLGGLRLDAPTPAPIFPAAPAPPVHAPPCPPAAVLKTLEGHPELILSTLQQTFWRTMVANYCL